MLCRLLLPLLCAPLAVAHLTTNGTQDFIPLFAPATTTAPTSLATSTVTETVTIIPSPPGAPSAPPLSSISGYTWSAPQQFAGLGAFSVLEFAAGQANLEIVNGIPAEAIAPSVVAASETSTSGRPNILDNSSSVIQIRYPANSVNPSRRPQGGAEFYATPLDLKDAQNVTLEYSVFFPSDFDWVLAGKLPGLYGGHTGCSGGDNAFTCFSTRLMWRQMGAGELYLVSV